MACGAAVFDYISIYLSKGNNNFCNFVDKRRHFLIWLFVKNANFFLPADGNCICSRHYGRFLWWCCWVWQCGGIVPSRQQSPPMKRRLPSYARHCCPPMCPTRRSTFAALPCILMRRAICPTMCAIGSHTIGFRAASIGTLYHLPHAKL